MELSRQKNRYCRVCAKSRLVRWDGWPNKNPVPFLPSIVNGCCGSCGKRGEGIENSQIYWLNYGEGLPDFWRLKVDDEGSKARFYTGHWGFPYFAEAHCPRCTGRTVISHHGRITDHEIPVVRGEFMHNCTKCGLVAVT